MPNSELVSALAVLKANADDSKDHKDYIDNFLPFISEAIKLTKAETISTPSIYKVLIQAFGIKIPHAVINTVISRMFKRNLLQEKDNRLIAPPELLSDQTFKRKQDIITKKQNNLFKYFISFCEKENINIEDCSDRENCFYSYISSNLLDIIKFNGKKNKHQSDIQCIKAEKINYATAIFLEHIVKESPTHFSTLEDIVKGNMILNGLYYSGVNEVYAEFKRTVVFLDTKIILMIAGIGSPEKCAPFSELCSLLKKANAIPACFEHTIDETLNILTHAKYQIENPNSKYINETTQYFIDNNFTPSDIDIVCSSLRRTISKHGVITKEKPSYEEKYGLNETKLEKILEHHIKYHNIPARKFDIDSIAATFRYRKGLFYEQIERSKAIFVTTNSKLAQATTEYFKKDFPGRSNGTMCITAHRLTNIAWAKLPNEAPDLPKKLIISQCLAALKPPQELWEKYLREVEKMYSQKELTPDEYTYLKYASIIKPTLHEVTSGSTEKFTAGTIDEILKRAKRKEHQRISEQLANEKKERKQLEAKIYGQKTKFNRISTVMVNTICITIACVIISSVAFYTFLSIQGLPAPPTHNVLFYIRKGALLIALVVSSLLIIFSSDLRKFLLKIRDIAVQNLTLFFWKHLGPQS